MRPKLRVAVWTLVAAAAFAPAGRAEEGGDLLGIDHYVRHASTVPAIAGETVQLYVRERVRAGVLARSPSFEGRVVLFVHGAGTPAEVAFDVPHPGYSWMAYLAAAGYDVFSMDMTGYGRSTRPAPMNDPCNVGAEAQAALMPAPLAATCEQSYPGQLTTVASDWDDIDAVVEHLRTLRRVERVSLIGWSLGGPRAGGYAARHPDKVAKLVLLAPAYTRDMPAAAPALPAPGPAMSVQSYADFTANWDRQVGCEDQYDPAVRERVWAEMLASDPVGAAWGPGVRRAPSTTVWGWNRDVVARTQAPMLLVAPVHDKQIAPERVRQLYDDLGVRQKVLLDLGCSSHAAMWERNRELLFRASLEWLRDGTVEGMEQGIVRLGY
ncbi:MAG TPA: alpha/beta fold hydrolase [Gammaproteobacteria bacterium]